MMEYDDEVMDEIDDSDLDALLRLYDAPQNGEDGDDEEEEDTEDETEEDEDEEAEDEDEEDVEKNSSPRRSSRLNPKKSEKETKEQRSGDMKTKKEMISKDQKQEEEEGEAEGKGDVAATTLVNSSNTKTRKTPASEVDESQLDLDKKKPSDVIWKNMMDKKVGIREGSKEMNKADEKVGTKRKRTHISASTNSRDGEEEEEEAVITKHARKKMKHEVEVKKKEMRSLKQKKEAAVDKTTKICSELECVRKFLRKEKESLEQLKREAKSSMEKADSLDRQIRELQKRKEKELLLKIEVQKSVKASQAKISQKEEEEKNLKLRHEEAKEEVIRKSRKILLCCLLHLDQARRCWTCSTTRSTPRKPISSALSASRSALLLSTLARLSTQFVPAAGRQIHILTFSLVRENSCINFDMRCHVFKF